MGWINNLFGKSKTPENERAAREKYVDRISCMLRNAGLSFDYNEAEYSLVGANWRFFLQNQFQEYTRGKSEEELAAIMDRHCQMLLAYTQTTDLKFEEVRNRLLPVVRERMFIVQHDFDYLPFKTLADFKSSDSLLHHELLAQNFVVMIAIDNPHHIANLPKTTVESWQIPPDQLMRLGLENLRAISEESFVEIAEGVYASCWHDNYDTSRILFHDIVERCDVNGHHVAFLLNRDNVLITGSQDVSGMKVILEIYKELRQLPRAMNLSPIVLLDDQWHKFVPERNHPCYHDIVNAHTLALNTYYAESQPKLISVLGDDTYVAKFDVIQKPGMKQYHSLTNWTCKSLLPKTEWVSFVEIDDKTNNPIVHGMARWEEVAEAIGDKFSPVIEFPPRIFVDSFIDKAVLTKLNLVNVPPDDKADTTPLSVQTYLERITRAHDIYLEKYKQFCIANKDKPKCAAEVCFEMPGAETEFMFKRGKLDFVMTIDDQIQGIYLVVPNISMETTEFKIAHGCTLTMKPICWYSIDIRSDKFDPTAKPFQDWCTYWLDLNETFKTDENGLSGSIHHVTIPKVEDNCSKFSVDFGSAPVEAFEQLLKILCQIGVSNISISSAWNTKPHRASA